MSDSDSDDEYTPHSKRTRGNETGTSSRGAKRVKRTTTTIPVAERIRDETYYKEDGDCVLLVENVIFKLPRSLLIRDSPAFEEMLKIREGASKHPYTTEKSPLVLEDLNVEDFRALCWLFFAFPDEISAQKDPSRVEFHRLISIFYITNRYKFERYQKWVHGLLSELCGKRGGHLGKCALSDYERLILLALEIPDATLKANTIQAWLRRFKADPSMRPAAALRFASCHNLRQFQGEILYHELLMMTAVASKNPNSTSIFPHRGDPLLKPVGDVTFSGSVVRLYRGLFSLSHYSDILRTPPEVPLTIPEPKYGHVRCIEHWKKMWERPQRQEGTKEPRSNFPDPLGVLKSLATFNPPDKRSNPEFCNCYFKTEAAALRKRLVETLADHFLGANEDPSSWSY